MNEKTIDSLYELIAYRKERFNTLASIFGAELPDEAVRAMLDSAKEDAPVTGIDNPEDELMESLSEIKIADRNAFATALRTEYARLFIGPRRVQAPLHESAYRGGKSRMFTNDTLDVRAFYKAFGYEVVSKNIEPDDSIFTELEFMAALCTKCLDILKEDPIGDSLSKVSSLIEAQRSFLQLHLGIWHHSFAQKVSENDLSGFYRAWARYLVRVIAEEERLTEQCISLIGKRLPSSQSTERANRV